MELLTENDFIEALTTSKYFETKRIVNEYPNTGESIYWCTENGIPCAFVDIKDGEFYCELTTFRCEYYELEYGQVRNNVRYLSHGGWGTEPFTWKNGKRNVLTKYHFFTTTEEAIDYIENFKKSNIKKLNKNIENEIKNRQDNISILQHEIDSLKNKLASILYTKRFYLDTNLIKSSGENDIMRSIYSFLYSSNQCHKKNWSKHSYMNEPNIYKIDSTKQLIILESIDGKVLNEIYNEFVNKFEKYITE